MGRWMKNVNVKEIKFWCVMAFGRLTYDVLYETPALSLSFSFLFIYNKR